MAKKMRDEDVPLSRTRFRVFAIAAVTAHVLCFLVSISLLIVAGHERRTYMEYFRLIPDSSRGVDHATSLITACASTSLAPPLIFFMAFLIVPHFLYSREQKMRRRAEATECDAHPLGRNPLNHSLKGEKNGYMRPPPLHALEAQTGVPAPPPLYQNAPLSHTVPATMPQIGKDTPITRFFVKPPFSRESTSEDERTVHGGPESILTESTLHTVRTSARGSPVSAVPPHLGTSPRASQERDCTTTTTTDAGSTAAILVATSSSHWQRTSCADPDSRAVDAEPVTPLSPNPPHRVHDEVECRQKGHEGSLSTLAPPARAPDPCTDPHALPSPLHAENDQQTSRARRRRELEARNRDAREADESHLPVATFYANFLVSSSTFRFLVWLYFLSCFVALIIIFACGTFGALSTVFASMNSGKDMEKGWIVAYVSHLAGGGLAEPFNNRLCKLQIDGKCSGTIALCNASTTATVAKAHANFCPICPASQQTRINDFTQLCSTRYYVGRHYPISYFVLITTAAVLLTVSFVSSIAIDDITIMPFDSYACNVVMAQIRSTPEWAHRIASQNFPHNWQHAHNDHTLSSLSTHPANAGQPPKLTAGMASHREVGSALQHTVTVTGSTVGQLSNVETLGTSESTTAGEVKNLKPEELPRRETHGASRRNSRAQHHQRRSINSTVRAHGSTYDANGGAVAAVAAAAAVPATAHVGVSQGEGWQTAASSSLSVAHTASLACAATPAAAVSVTALASSSDGSCITVDCASVETLHEPRRQPPPPAPPQPSRRGVHTRPNHGEVVSRAHSKSAH